MTTSHGISLDEPQPFQHLVYQPFIFVGQNDNPINQMESSHSIHFLIHSTCTLSVAPPLAFHPFLLRMNTVRPSLHHYHHITSDHISSKLALLQAQPDPNRCLRQPTTARLGSCRLYSQFVTRHAKEVTPFIIQARILFRETPFCTPTSQAKPGRVRLDPFPSFVLLTPSPGRVCPRSIQAGV